jgi:MFS family permease
MQSKTEQVAGIIEQIGWGLYQKLSFVVCGMAWSTIMMYGCLVSITIKEAGKEWSLSSFEEGMVATGNTFGIFVGSAVWGHVGGLYGRLRGVQIAEMLNCAAGLSFILSFNLSMLVINSVLVGFFTSGSLVLASSLYVETLPKKENWTTVLLAVLLVCGGVIAYATAIFFLLIEVEIISLWREVAVVALVLQIFYLACTVKLLESPKFLVTKDRDRKAEKVLE